MIRRRRRRIATALLLVLQAIGLIAFVTFIGSGIDWDLEFARSNPSTRLTNFIFVATAGGPVAVVAIVAAIALLFRLPQGWLLAMFAQGVLLFNSLMTYIGRGSEWVFPFMVMGVLMVLYLNSYAARSALQPSSSTGARTEKGGHEPAG